MFKYNREDVEREALQNESPESEKQKAWKWEIVKSRDKHARVSGLLLRRKAEGFAGKIVEGYLWGDRSAVSQVKKKSIKNRI